MSADPQDRLGPLCDKINEGNSLDKFDLLSIDDTELRYALFTPFALIDLSLSGIVSGQEWVLIFSSPQAKEYLRQRPGGNASTLLVLILERFDEQHKRVSECVGASIRSFLLEQMASWTAIQLTKGIEEVTTWLNQCDSGRVSEEMWLKKRCDLERTLNEYGWIADNGWHFTQTLQHISRLSAVTSQKSG